MEHSPQSQPLVDPAGRRMEYLRLSVTDACNFRCSYCLPGGWRPGTDARDDVLTVAEVATLVRGLAPLGLRKVRLTGGEPTVRKDLLALVACAAGVPAVQTVALSTNGWNLKRLARPLRDAGLHAVNVSVDALDRARFEVITGRDVLPRVLDGVHAALAAGLRVKVNAVHLHASGEDVLTRWLDFVKVHPVTVRFIELMRTADNAAFFLHQHRPLDDLRTALTLQGWSEHPRGLGDGPAAEWSHPAYAGGVGFIAPYAKDFCDTCNRLRVTSRGELRLCLFGDANVSLREHLQPGGEGGLQRAVRQHLAAKPPAHRLHTLQPGNTRNLSQWGG